LHQITIRSSYYESCDIKLWKKWYLFVWPVMNFEGNSFFRNAIKFYQSTDISDKSSIFIWTVVKTSKLSYVFYTCNFLNRCGYSSDHLFECSNNPPKSIFVTGYSGHLFSSYAEEVIFLNRIYHLFFVVGNSVFILR
jgi:hypothetical protein